jgi:DNA-binding CsgD family transcriptional regulator
MSPQRLVERDKELSRLLEACARATAGDGGVVAIRGPAGIGKTALLRAAAGAGAEEGFRILSASGTELEQELAFGIVRQLFERRLRGLPEAARSELLAGTAGIASAVLLDRSSADVPESLDAALHGLYWLAAELAAREPLLLVVDDVQWADATSLLWLAYLGRRLDGVPLLLALGCRDGEPGVDERLLEQVLSESHARLLRPRPLTRDGVKRWLAASLTHAADDAFASCCWERTGGNPFLLCELTADLRVDGSAGHANALRAIEQAAPATIARSVLARLAREGNDAIRVAESVAVLSRDARIDLVARLAGVGVARTAEIIDRLTTLEILGRSEPVAFAHPVLRSAVYEQVPHARRGLMHREVAWMLREHGTRPEHVATHLLLAPPCGDDTVVETLRAAGARAIAQGAPEAAVPLLRRALGEPARERAEVLVELAVAEALAQDAASIEHARAVVDESPVPALRARAALVAAEVLFRSGHEREARDMLNPAGLDDLEAALTREVRATALMMATYTDASQLDAALSELGADALEGDDMAERMLLALRALDFMYRAFPREQSVSVARRIVAKIDRADEDPEFVLGAVAGVFYTAECLDQARCVLGRMIHSGRRRGVASSVAYACALRADLEFRAGRLADAEADAREALELMSEHSHWSLPVAVAHLINSLVDRQPPEAGFVVLADYDIEVPASAPAPVWAVHYLFARGRLQAAAGDLAKAADDFTACGELNVAWGEVNPAHLAWRSNLGLALHALGRAHHAKALIDEDVTLASRYGAPRAIGIALRARALLQRGAAAIGGLEDAVRVLEASTARLEHARALVDLGAALRRSGRRSEALEVLRTALDAADRCGAHQLAARARHELHATGARPRRERLSGPEALTASERRVAQMAAQGLTNRQIAQALFVTTKTVEMHLAHAYSKLDVGSRNELPAVLDGRHELDMAAP